MKEAGFTIDHEHNHCGQCLVGNATQSSSLRPQVPSVKSAVLMTFDCELIGNSQSHLTALSGPIKLTIKTLSESRRALAPVFHSKIARRATWLEPETRANKQPVPVN